MRRVHCAALLALVAAGHAHAGVFEISGNGTFYMSSDRPFEGYEQFTRTHRLGGGLGYRFTEVTTIALNYTDSKSVAQVGFKSLDSTGVDVINHITMTTRTQNVSLNLELSFAGKTATFRPYIMGGGGYMIRNKKISGRQLETGTTPETPINRVDDELRTASADAGIGFKLFIADRTAIEVQGLVYASDLDKDLIYLQYAVTGGLKFLF